MPALETQKANVWYDDNHVIKDVSMKMKSNKVTAIIGPSGCGKSTYLRLFNRMNDLIQNAHVKGKIMINGKDVYSENLRVEDIRKKVGMVFQEPNPFPKSIYENVAFGLKINGMTQKNYISERVEQSLKDAALWEEVKDNLDKSAYELSGGQQQRLCIARALAVEPSIVLMDEPASALDPISTSRIEDLIHGLKDKYTIVIVTHNMQQAARISDMTAFLYMGELIEYDDTELIFTNPREEKTQNYVTGRFG